MPEQAASVGAHPASPIDYALINVSYLGALAGIGAVLHRRQDEIDLSPREVVLLVLATFSLADVFAHERIATWIAGLSTSKQPTIDPAAPKVGGCAMQLAS